VRPAQLVVVSNAAVYHKHFLKFHPRFNVRSVWQLGCAKAIREILENNKVCLGPMSAGMAHRKAWHGHIAVSSIDLRREINKLHLDDLPLVNRCRKPSVSECSSEINRGISKNHLIGEFHKLTWVFVNGVPAAVVTHPHIALAYCKPGVYLNPWTLGESKLPPNSFNAFLCGIGLLLRDSNLFGGVNTGLSRISSGLTTGNGQYVSLCRRFSELTPKKTMAVPTPMRIVKIAMPIPHLAKEILRSSKELSSSSSITLTRSGSLSFCVSLSDTTASTAG